MQIAMVIIKHSMKNPDCSQNCKRETRGRGGGGQNIATYNKMFSSCSWSPLDSAPLLIHQRMVSVYIGTLIVFF